MARWKQITPGGQLSANDENDKALQLEALLLGLNAPGYYGPDGAAMLAQSGVDVGFAVKITALHDDYLTVQPWDGSAAVGGTFSAAKPYELRKSTWDGVTVGGVTFAEALGDPQQRTATAVAGVEVHQVFPRYEVNSIIRVLLLVNGAGLLDASSSPIMFEDINNAARAFLCTSSS